jgi:hypothetical protein
MADREIYPSFKTAKPKRAKTRRNYVERMGTATNGCCFYCGWSLRDGGGRDFIFLRGQRDPMIDHKTPEVRGGTNDSDNLVLSCAECNLQKSSLTADEFRFVMGLRRGTLNFVFPFETPKPVQRDWLCISSADFEKSLTLHNVPTSKGHYNRRRGGYWRA